MSLYIPINALCDDCGHKETFVADNLKEAAEIANLEGWDVEVYRDEKSGDYKSTYARCPNCLTKEDQP